MAANNLFFCLHVNLALFASFSLQNSFADEKRIIYWLPFWNKVYGKDILKAFNVEERKLVVLTLLCDLF